MDERRKWLRFIPVETIASFQDSSGSDRTAKVLNESVGGAALACYEGDAPVRGTVIYVTLRDSTIPAIVWHSRREIDGAIVFGVEWIDHSETEDDKHTFS
jgi:hypothetical protein